MMVLINESLSAVLLQSDLPSIPSTFYGLMGLMVLLLVYFIIRPLLERASKEADAARERLFKLVDEVSSTNQRSVLALEQSVGTLSRISELQEKIAKDMYDNNRASVESLRSITSSLDVMSKKLSSAP